MVVENLSSDHALCRRHGRMCCQECRARARQLDKGIALLKSLIAPHDGLDKNDDHAWRKCRKCLAREELDHKGSDEALQAVLASLTKQE